MTMQLETRLIPLTKGKFAIVDAADYELLSQFKWHVLKPRNTCYAVRMGLKGYDAQRHVYMHRQIIGAPHGALVDHWDGDGLNNTRANLRIATTQQNGRNHGGKRNHHGFKGVSWSEDRQKWCALIKADGKVINLGRYSTAEEAARVYDAAARKAFGEFAWTNFREE